MAALQKAQLSRSWLMILLSRRMRRSSEAVTNQPESSPSSTDVSFAFGSVFFSLSCIDTRFFQFPAHFPASTPLLSQTRATSKVRSFCIARSAAKKAGLLLLSLSKAQNRRGRISLTWCASPKVYRVGIRALNPRLPGSCSVDKSSTPPVWKEASWGVHAVASNTDPFQLEGLAFMKTLQAACCQSYRWCKPPMRWSETKRADWFGLKETGRSAGVSFSSESWIRSA